MISKIFISHHFDDTAMDFAEMVSRLVKSHGFLPVTGKRLMGQQLSQGVKDRMDECQATIVLLTHRDEGKTNQWVQDERGYAEGRKHKLITLLEKGLHDEGMFKDKERLRIETDNLQKVILDLSETLNLWKFSSGKNMRLLLQPDAISNIISSQVGNIPIRYRIWRDDSRDIDGNNNIPRWVQTFARPEAGGATIFIRGVQKNDLIEVETNIDGKRWASRAANPNVIVRLTQS